MEVVTLAAVRRFLRSGSFGGAIVLFGLLYLVGALFSSGMVAFGNFQGGYTVEWVVSNPTGVQPWNYPGLLVVAPWGVVTLPFFPTLAMVVVSVGVGFGMAVAALLTIRLIRPSAREQARGKAVGAVTGLTPAMISLVTLGACCSTTAAATAGVGLVADASATTVANLLLNNWYLGAFQIVIVWVSLLAQELLLTVYTGLYGGEVPGAAPAPPPFRRWLSAGALRVALLVGGLLWMLSVLVAWTSVAPATAGPLTWSAWLLQREAVGLLAVALALFPEGTLDALAASRSDPWGRWANGVLVAASASLLLVYPAALVGAGWTGVGNVLPTLGGAGVGDLAAGLFRVVVEYGALGAVGLTAALAPSTARRWLAPRPAATPSVPPAVPEFGEGADGRGPSEGAPARWTEAEG